MDKLIKEFFSEDNISFGFQIMLRLAILLFTSTFLKTTFMFIYDLTKQNFNSLLVLLQELLVLLQELLVLLKDINLTNNAILIIIILLFLLIYEFFKFIFKFIFEFIYKIESSIFSSPFPIFIPIFIFLLLLNNDFIVTIFIIFFCVTQNTILKKSTRRLFLINLDDESKKDEINDLKNMQLGFRKIDHLNYVKKLISVLKELITEFDEKKEIQRELHMMKEDYYILRRFDLIKISEHDNKYNIYIKNDVYEFYSTKTKKGTF
jgi:hypothetical protein